MITLIAYTLVYDVVVEKERLHQCQNRILDDEELMTAIPIFQFYGLFSLRNSSGRKGARGAILLPTSNTHGPIA